MHAACWSKSRRAGTIFFEWSPLAESSRLNRKARDREDAITNTREACATQIAGATTQHRQARFKFCIVASDMKIETVAVHAGHAVDPTTGAVAAPIYLSTTFERAIEGTYSRGFMYARNDNPNRQALERGVSMLEGGEAAAAFASGTGATMSILQALTPGDHVL